MTEKFFELQASDEYLMITFNPPITQLQWRAIWTLMATEYKLQDADNAFRRFVPETSEVKEVTWTSWRPHGTKFPDSLIEKMRRDVALILNGHPVERTRLVDLTRMLGLKDEPPT